MKHTNEPNHQKTELPEAAMKRVVGGLDMANPVAALSEEEALAIAAELGDGKDMGSWRTMSGEQFMAWWRQSHPKTPPQKS